MQTNARERALLVITALVLLLAVLQLGVIKPLLSDIRAKRTRVAISAQELSRLEALVASRDEQERIYGQIRDRLDSSSDSLQREIIDMLISIEDIADSSGIEIVENSHYKDEVLEHFRRHTVRLRGVGEMKSVLSMLHGLQTSDHLFKIRSMKLTMRDHRLEVELEIVRIGLREVVQ